MCWEHKTASRMKRDGGGNGKSERGADQAEEERGQRGDGVRQLGHQTEQRRRDDGDGEEGGQRVEEGDHLLVLEVLHVSAEGAQRGGHALQLAQRRGRGRLDEETGRGTLQHDVEGFLLVDLAAELLDEELCVREERRGNPEEEAKMVNGVHVGRGLLLLEKGEGEHHVGKEEVETALDLNHAWQCYLQLGVDGGIGTRRMPVA